MLQRLTCAAQVRGHRDQAAEGSHPVRRAGDGEDAAREGGRQLDVSHLFARCAALPLSRAAACLLTHGAHPAVVGSELIQKYLGDGPKLVRELFRVADELAPSIVFIGAYFVG